jgi:D-alanyl-D-alanine dipeptidase
MKRLNLRHAPVLAALGLLLGGGGSAFAAPPAKDAQARCATTKAAPPAPPETLRRWVGQYGDVGAVLDLSEQCGVLIADGDGFHAVPLRRQSPGRFEAPSPDGTGVRVFALEGEGVEIDGKLFPRHDFGAEVEARIHAAVRADPGKLRAAALAASPPYEPPSKRASDLVSLPVVDPTIHLHTLYAGTDNFLGVPIYERAGAYMQRPAAEALARASTTLRSYGYGLLVTDAYRPWFATKMFWDATPPEDHNFVADPAQGSRHNRGCAVDLTLYDLKTGQPVEMTGRVDEMSARSFAHYAGGTTRQRWLRDLLRQAMEAEGFTFYPDEWWHFDYKDWTDYPIGTATYTALAAGAAR